MWCCLGRRWCSASTICPFEFSSGASGAAILGPDQSHALIGYPNRGRRPANRLFTGEFPMKRCLMGLALLSSLAGPAFAGPAEPDLAAVRAATERFRDVKVALAEGYIADPMKVCDTADMMGRPKKLGAMGIHYFRPDLLGITAPPNPRVDGTGTHTNFLKPGILIYEPRADGSLELVAVENLVFAKAWH